ncbi:KTSC domain-containing protein [Candidatus Woesearchaeota archaeon]|nr:KTSC domain-containing protein [Candidatus Woesearchaeota archaeon]
MDRKPVISSNLISVGYDEEAKTLEIEFKNGVYQYLNVPRNVYDALMQAPSKGRHFHGFIRDKFTPKKIR